MFRFGAESHSAADKLGLPHILNKAAYDGVSPRTFSLIYQWVKNDEDYLILFSNSNMLTATRYRNVGVMRLLKRYMIRFSMQIALGSMLEKVANNTKLTRMIKKWSKGLKNTEFRIGLLSNRGYK